MSSFVQVKVPGGKLLQLEKRSDGYKITGDFFCYPESVVEDLEVVLSAVDDDEVKRKGLEEIFAGSEVEIVGFGMQDLWKLYNDLNLATD